MMPSYRQTAMHKNLRTRMLIFQAIRTFFAARDYLEVETPCRLPALAPETHIDAIPSADWFLQTSPELCMKRLLAAGFQHIYQICRCFRQGERGRKHLPELTMLEWYGAGHTYMDLMHQTEALICFIARELEMGTPLNYQGCKIDLKTPWERMTVADAFERYAPLTMAEALEKDVFDEIMVDEIEPRLGSKQPIFIYDYPAARGALARLKAANPSVAERFELYMGSLELCNGFSELTDPVEQHSRFEIELKNRKDSGKIVSPMPENFLESLHDLPAAAGNALGIDRLVMLFTDTKKIDDVVAFVPEEL